MGLRLIEGRRLVFEALQAGEVRELFVTDPAWLAFYRTRGAPRVSLISRRDLQRLADVKTPQEVLAVGPLPKQEDPLRLSQSCQRLLLLDGVQDPGNAGTLVRTARALGLQAVLTLGPTADLSAPKVLRASAGALFGFKQGHLVDSDHLATLLAGEGHDLVLPVVSGGRDLRNFPPPARFVLVAGNEGAGTSLKDQFPGALLLSIPLHQGMESLNVMAALAAILGHWLAAW